MPSTPKRSLSPRFHPGGRLIIPALTWTPLVAALSDFLSGAVALLPRHRCPLTHPRSPLPSAIAGLRAAAPRAPGVPLAIGCNRITNQAATLSPILDAFALVKFAVVSLEI